MAVEAAEKVIIIYGILRSLQVAVAVAVVPVLLALTAPFLKAAMEELAYTTVPSSVSS
jgi:hypothetical protein